jgi:hypothetical protein
MAALRVAWIEIERVEPKGKKKKRRTDAMGRGLVDLFDFVLEVCPLFVGGAGRGCGPLGAEPGDDVAIGDEMEQGVRAGGGREAVLIGQDDVIERLGERRKGRTWGFAFIRRTA